MLVPELIEAIGQGSEEANEAALVLGLLIEREKVYHPIPGDDGGIRQVLGEQFVSRRLSKIEVTEAVDGLIGYINEAAQPLPRAVWALAKSYEPRTLPHFMNLLDRFVGDAGKEELVYQALLGMMNLYPTGRLRIDEPSLIAIRRAAREGHGRVKEGAVKYLQRNLSHAIRRYNRNNLARPCINEGRFYLAGQGSDWVIQRHIIREQGVVVAGPAPQTLIDPVAAKDIQWSVLAFLRGWWAPMLEQPKRLQSSEYQAYAVVTMCRVLYTLQIGTIASKPVAARWAQETLEQRWAGLIEEALRWRAGIEMDKFDDTLDFIRYAVECGEQFD